MCPNSEGLASFVHLAPLAHTWLLRSLFWEDSVVSGGVLRGAGAGVGGGGSRCFAGMRPFILTSSCGNGSRGALWPCCLQWLPLHRGLVASAFCQALRGLGFALVALAFALAWALALPLALLLPLPWSWAWPCPALELELDLDLDLDLELERELDLELKLDLELALDCELELEFDLDLDLELDREFELGLDLVLDQQRETPRFAQSTGGPEAGPCISPSLCDHCKDIPS